MTDVLDTFAGLRAVTVGDQASAKAIVVLLHGFGMRPTDLSPFADSLRVPAWFVFPEAPYEASIGGRAWWFIDAALREAAIAKGPRDFAAENPPELDASADRLDALLDEISAIAAGRPVVVGGFSQGGMLTAHTLLRHPRNSANGATGANAVSAIALLSASRVAWNTWPPRLASGAVRGLPILVSHGETDADLAFSAGEALRDCLTEAGADVTWVPFEQGHEIPLVVWRALRKLLLCVTA